MGAQDWNWRLETDLQDVPWDCAACSTAWCLRTLGLSYTEDQVVVGLGPTRISPTYGLLDATGAGIVDWLATIGVQAWNNGSATWDEVMAAAGEQPMLIGGRAWCHWVGVRMGARAAGRPDLDLLALMNPSPGYENVGQLLDSFDFGRLGEFSAIWLAT